MPILKDVIGKQGFLLQDMLMLNLGDPKIVGGRDQILEICGKDRWGQKKVHSGGAFSRLESQFRRVMAAGMVG